jgi:hypothetical protein
MTAEQVEAFATVIAAIAALAAIAVAQDQLKNLAESSGMNGLMTVLQLESEMDSRAQRLDRVTLHVRKN